jgi:hypothetical protein
LEKKRGSQTLIRRALKRLTETGLAEGLQKVASAGEENNQNRLNVESLG